MTTWGQQLRTLRKHNKLSQEELGDKLVPSVSKGYISEIETGKKNPSLRVAKQLQELFNNSLSAEQGIYEGRDVPQLAQAI